MTSLKIEQTVHAAADLAAGQILATVELNASAERVFRALSSRDIIDWWVRPGVFDTTEWEGDVRAGGRWRSAGTGRGKPYVLEGEFLEVDAPRKLVQTYHLAGTPFAPTLVSFCLEPVGQGTRVTLRHTGFTSGPLCEANRAGWEACFERLGEILVR